MLSVSPLKLSYKHHKAHVVSQPDFPFSVFAVVSNISIPFFLLALPILNIQIVPNHWHGGKSQRTIDDRKIGEKNPKEIVTSEIICYDINEEQSCYKVVTSLYLKKRGGGAYEYI